MKTHKYILGISLLVTIVSFVFVIFSSDGSKLFQIMLAFMGSAFVAFLLEIPNYISLKKENKNKIYGSLFWLKSHLTMLNNTIEKVLEDNKYIPQFFYNQSINQINSDLFVLSSFDLNYYMTKSKRELCSSVINDLTYKVYNLTSITTKYSISYGEKKIALIQKQKYTPNMDDNILPEMMRDELTEISSLCLSYIKYIDAQVKKLFSDKQHNMWELDDKKIKEMTETFKSN